MHAAYTNTDDADIPRFRLTVLKGEKPSIRDILLAAVDTPGHFQAPGGKPMKPKAIASAKEKTKADSIPGDTWYMK